MIAGADLGEFGHWLAGFIDGEGCFLIPYRRDRDHWYCQFRIRVRVDDEMIVREIHAATGIGRVFVYAGQRGSSPLVCWEVSSRGDCLQLVDILEAHPLRAKKARDFEIWRQAVHIWAETKRGGTLEQRRTANAAGWAAIAGLSRELRDGRQFVNW